MDAKNHILYLILVIVLFFETMLNFFKTLLGLPNWVNIISGTLIVIGSVLLAIVMTRFFKLRKKK